MGHIPRMSEAVERLKNVFLEIPDTQWTLGARVSLAFYLPAHLVLRALMATPELR